jgi:hypothetical protein
MEDQIWFSLREILWAYIKGQTKPQLLQQLDQVWLPLCEQLWDNLRGQVSEQLNEDMP